MFMPQGSLTVVLFVRASATQNVYPPILRNTKLLCVLCRGEYAGSRQINAVEGVHEKRI